MQPLTSSAELPFTIGGRGTLPCKKGLRPFSWVQTARLTNGRGMSLNSQASSLNSSHSYSHKSSSQGSSNGDRCATGHPVWRCLLGVNACIATAPHPLHNMNTFPSSLLPAHFLL